MEIGVDNSPEKVGVAMEFPVVAGEGLSSPPTMPPRLRRRLTETKASPSTVEEIESKLRDADLRRQKFYEHLSSKARARPMCPLQSGYYEDLGQRLQAKLLAAEPKRSSILAKAQLRLAKLDELRQAARTGVEVRVKKESAELGTKVELRARQAETNRMRILKAYGQRRATLRERTSQSLMRRIARESKYRECVGAAISQKRAAAEKKRLASLEADMERAHNRLLQVKKVTKCVSQKREIERRRLRESLEDKLQRAKRQRAEYLMQRAKLLSSVGTNWTKKMQKQADYLSRKLARCWRKFLKRKTTFVLAKNYSVLNINEDHVKSMPFEQFAVLIETPSKVQMTRALLDRLEIHYKALMNTASGVNYNGQSDIDHLLKRVASPSRRTTPRTPSHNRHIKKPGPTRAISKSNIPVFRLSRYQVRIVLCAYMIVAHPDAVFSGQGERETALAESAKKFIQEFELLINIILHGRCEDSIPVLPRRTFRSQLSAFDLAWCAYLNSFVVWKVKDAESLEEDLVRAACQMEISMMQTCKLTSEGDNVNLTHYMKAIQKQVTEDQQLLKERVRHLSGDAGIERMNNALSDTRRKYFKAVENGNSMASPVAHIPPSANSDKKNTSEEPSHVVRSLFKDDDSKPHQKVAGSSAASSSRSPEGHLNHSDEIVGMENELIVNEFVHGQHYPSANTLNGTNEDQTLVKVRKTMKKAFWNGIIDSIEDNYDRVVELMKEVRDELCEMAPQSWKQEIIEAIDVAILSQLLKSDSLDMEYLGQIMEFALVSLQKLSAPANEINVKDAHQNVLQELADICRADDSNRSHAIALVKGLRFVLEQIQALKLEISNARIKIMEPLLKGPAGLEYLGKAFTKRFGTPSEASTRLPLTMRWLSSLGPTYDQDWVDHQRVLSGLQEGSPSEKLVLPSIALRTGGSFSNGLQTSTSVYVTDAAAGKFTELAFLYPECKGERRDLLVRLGLLKLVNDVYGVTQDELPETLKLNFLRLRLVQSQLQQIIVTATSILVFRQTLVMEKMISSPDEMETTIQKCSTDLLQILDTVENAGLEEIVEVLSKTADGFDKSSDPTKAESRRLVMARMLRKSVQAEDAVFVKVSRAVYLATRGVLLGGSGNRGRLLAEMALRQVGAAVLTDRVVEAGKVLGVMASVTERVHWPWYDQLIENV
ncbi:hypothetical protein M8C21_018068 [Ambrosia artemisiifolia]|uniref:T-complex protein 11-like protein 1 n=1 Tax=Ambrosia artemisiifolia TaxID=4212 RepID=A0AAD5BRH1_AMBAR|nr:hypothetical protein M8C21_018068 [Ambrosia artemisiifolia]